MITPTIGRIVWFTPPWNRDERRDTDQPLAAIVVYVYSDREVNLVVFGQDGYTEPRIGVSLLQDDDGIPTDTCYAQWMPYQIGAARRYEVENEAAKAWDETIADKE